jgi:hypothetical protein
MTSGKVTVGAGEPVGPGVFVEVRDGLGFGDGVSVGDFVGVGEGDWLGVGEGEGDGSGPDCATAGAAVAASRTTSAVGATWAPPSGMPTS